MDAVDILLFCVVGFSVLLFLIVNSFEESRKTCLQADQSSVNSNFESKTRSRQHVSDSSKPSDDQGEENHEKQLVFQEITEEEEAEDPVNANLERSGYRSGLLDVSGNTEIDICMNLGVDGECDGKGEEESLDDWEGVERTELEKTFGEAVVFASDKRNADRIDGDVKLVLYGLQKVALEGPCHGSQPMALKVSARAKWNAWQKLGNMSRETAMEKYIDILVKAIPAWKGDCIGAVKDACSSEDLTPIPYHEYQIEADIEGILDLSL